MAARVAALPRNNIRVSNLGYDPRNRENEDQNGGDVKARAAPEEGRSSDSQVIPCGQTDGTNMTKLAVAFRNSFVKAHKNGEFNNFKSLQHSYLYQLKNIQISV
jgi:hypothetical protein